ncbi:MAG: DUF106 domain-containing protein [Deltaproteobacteria bacterium]|nr:DUF106 domain-containing protein [Deltaproteobacteria bacterium]MBW2070773.1 DUF106 domain-containing protein [Deltaproteobacteria bacterium]
MTEVLDMIWLKVAAAIYVVRDLLASVLSPLDVLGPPVAIFLIACLTVAITKVLAKIYKTRRHQQLEKEFTHWFNIRQEALTSADPEKAKALAKNIDEAKLNKVYYDYFFEGLMKSLATTYLPILSLLAYVNDVYRPARLIILSGHPYIFKLALPASQPVEIGAPFWFIISLLLVYVALFSIRRIIRKGDGNRAPSNGKQTEPLPQAGDTS